MGRWSHWSVGVWLLVLALGVGGPAGAATFYVDGVNGNDSWTGQTPGAAKATIQAGIDAAADDDTVIVAQATYYENVRLHGKAITLSSSDPCNAGVVAATVVNGLVDPVTVIDGLEVGAAIVCWDQEEPNTIIKGFTITGGTGIRYPGQSLSFGGGIFIDNASPTFRYCVIQDNTCTRAGGGVYAQYFSYPTFEDCQFINNSATDNWASGGGFDAVTAAIIARRCQFQQNSSKDGGAVSVVDPCQPLIFEQCTFEDNTASRYGGALYLSEAEATLDEVRCTGNEAASNGGAIYQKGITGKMFNCLLTGNVSGGQGGACYLSNATKPIIQHCTIVGNKAATTGAGIRCITNSNVTLRNNIIYDNQPDQLYAATSAPTVTYNNIQGGYTGKGNVDVDPCFVYVGSWAGDVWVEDPCDNAYRLDPCSLCIDAGDPNTMPFVDSVDIDGDSRWCQSAPDMGIDEAWPNRRVQNSGTGQWYAGVGDAVAAAAQLGDELIVMPGRFVENVYVNKDVWIRSVQPHNKLCVAATVLDGSEPADPCYASTMELGVGTDVELAGLTITGGAGSVSGTQLGLAGGGVHGIACSLSLKDCVIYGNSADYGGGLAAENADPNILRCVFSTNQADYGGAIAALGQAHPRLQNTLLMINTANQDGGGIFCDDADVDVLLCTLRDQTVSSLHVQNGGQAQVSSSILWNVDPNTEAVTGDLGSVQIEYSVVDGGWGDDDATIIELDPGFSRATTQTFQDDAGNMSVSLFYEIGIISKAINRGDRDLVLPDGAVDIAGQDRVTFCYVDAGAFEVQNPINIGLHLVVRELEEQGHYCSIQEAIDALPEGSEIILSEGRYYEHVRLDKANMILRSTTPTNEEVVTKTIIDASQACVPCDPCDPNCVDYCEYGSAVTLLPSLASNCKVQGLTLINGTGYLDDGANVVDPYGAFGRGGGLVSFSNNNLEISNCRIYSNDTDIGAGIYIYNSKPLRIKNSRLFDNEAVYGGGGIRLVDCNDVTMSNCIVEGNLSQYGAGIYVVDSNPVTLDFCTFYGNEAGLSGGGVRFADDARGKVENSILWGNVPDQVNTYDDPCFLLVNYCNVQGGVDPNTATDGAGNINQDPCFVQPGYRDDNGTPADDSDDFWVEGDYHLLTEAPSRNQVSSIAGDLTDDGYTQLDDFQQFAAEWGETGTSLAGDLDNDGEVDPNDLVLWAADFLKTDPNAQWTPGPGTSPCIDMGDPTRAAGTEDRNEKLYQGDNLWLNMGAYGNTNEASMAPEGWSDPNRLSDL